MALTFTASFLYSVASSLVNQPRAHAHARMVHVYYEANARVHDGDSVIALVPTRAI